VLTSNGVTLAQGALADLWSPRDRTIPIPGFKSLEQVEENVGHATRTTHRGPDAKIGSLLDDKR
jgi:aryl-alcohol dehydrogenase-like predicted oxidoreductase